MTSSHLSSVKHKRVLRFQKVVVQLQLSSEPTRRCKTPDSQNSTCYCFFFAYLFSKRLIGDSCGKHNFMSCHVTFQAATFRGGKGSSWASVGGDIRGVDWIRVQNRKGSCRATNDNQLLVSVNSVSAVCWSLLVSVILVLSLQSTRIWQAFFVITWLGLVHTMNDPQLLNFRLSRGLQRQ